MDKIKFRPTPFFWQACVLILIGVLIRIPIISDPELMLDADEAVIGLMAQDCIERGTFPTYFIGQQYGLSTLEVASASLTFTLFGMEDWAQKISSLLIWLPGVIFFYKFLLQLNPKEQALAFVICAILVSAPTWLYWGMKSRGGYISAFSWSAFLLMVMTQKKVPWSNPRAVLIGAGLGLLSQFHLLWLLSLLPISFYFIVKTKQWQQLKFLGVGLFGSLLFLFLVKFKQTVIWNPSLLYFDKSPLDWLAQLPNMLIHQLSGTYYLGSLKDTKMLALLFSSLVLLSLLVASFFILKKAVQTRTWLSLEVVTLVSILGSIALTFFLLTGARYLLPTLMVILLLLFLTLQNTSYLKWAIPSLIVAASLSSSIADPFSNDHDRYQFQTQLNKTRTKDLITGLKTQSISNVFVMNGLCQYQIMFYTKGKVNAHYLLAKDRMQNRIDAVETAYLSGQNTAFVLLKPSDRTHFKESQMVHLNNRMTLVLNPTLEQLEPFGFETEHLKAAKTQL